MEKQVFNRIERYADEFEFDSHIAKSIFGEIIKASVNVQMQSQELYPVDQAKHCLIYGGNGKMGRWMTHFLQSSGHHVDRIDPSLTVEEAKDINSYDFIILATPLTKTKQVLEEIIEQQPQGIIFDIASLKSQLIPSIERGLSKGLRIGSIHPMFGPEVISLDDRNIVICQMSSTQQINEEIAALFAETSVNLIQTPLENHDNYMSYSLGLSHFLNLLFGKMLKESNHEFKTLVQFAGTTFAKQLQTSQEVFSENPALYYAIQQENDFTEELYETLLESSKELMSLVNKENGREFEIWMTETSTFLHDAEDKFKPKT